MPAEAAESPYIALRAVEHELADFTYSVSHDLGAPFRHILGFTELLRLEGGTRDSPEQCAYLDQVQAAANKGAAMVDTLLRYSRIQQKALIIERCDLGLLIDTVRLQLSGRIEQLGAEISVGKLADIEGDSDMLIAAFREILDNALKFIRPGVRPIVSVSTVENATNLVVRFVDNGIGIPPAEMEKVFRMFYKGHAVGSYPGIGTGLPIALRILRRHGGNLRTVARAHGACFEMTCPRAARSSQ